MSDVTFGTLPARVVHPLDDAPEAKLYRADLGPMRLTRGARFCLLALRAYLALMVLLVAWRVVGLAGGI